MFLTKVIEWSRARPHIHYGGPVAACALAIMAGSLMPPSNLPDIQFGAADKWEHLVAYGVQAALTLRALFALTRLGPAARCAAAVVLCTVWGILMEFLQTLTPLRSYELYDMLADVLGALLGCAVYAVFTRRYASGARLAESQEGGLGGK